MCTLQRSRGYAAIVQLASNQAAIASFDSPVRLVVRVNSSFVYSLQLSRGLCACTGGFRPVGSTWLLPMLSRKQSRVRKIPFDNVN